MSQPIDGTVIYGFSKASEVLLKLWPRLNEVFPEIKHCHQGTINVRLDAPVLILNPDCTVPPFEWEPNNWEAFSFLRIKFEWPIEAEPISAWIIIPQNSPHRYKMNLVEVIAPKIDGLRQNTRCRVHLPHIRGFIV